MGYDAGGDGRRGLLSRRHFGGLLAAAAVPAAVTVLTACEPSAGPAPAAGTAVPPPPVSPSSGPAGASPESTTAPAPVTAAASAEPAAPSTAAPAPTSPAATAPGPHNSLSDPASPWVVVNKHRPLSPAAFIPPDLVQPAVRLAVSGESALLNGTTAAAAERMFEAAAAAGVVMTLASGYRSFVTQTSTYNGYVATRGQAEADTASARPGYSEHQTGWSFDIGDGGGACSFQPCFAEQPAAVWAKANAHRFGFIVRYPWMYHGITGYYYESWHLRYIGVEAAGDMYARGIATLEEYFGLEAAPAYL